MKKKICVFIFCLVLFQLLAQSSNFTEPTASDKGFAQEEFRNGVQAWYRGSFNESILQFEKSLSYLPKEPLILDWLGKAYFKSGLEGTALEQWQLASHFGYGGNLLKNRIDIVNKRRITGSDIQDSIRFVETGSFPGSNENSLFFSQPISVLPLKNGTVWVLAYGSNELLLFDVNGQIIKRNRGPLNGFDRPMDIIEQKNGNLLVSEYAGDRIAVLDKDANFISYIGSSGRGDGELLGPQYLAQDSSENIYVTDYGNGRVVVYDHTGQWLFNFGQFTSPTGIVIVDDIVYIADNVLGNIAMYDTSGNFLDVLVEEDSFNHIESLRDGGEYLLAADTNKVYSIDYQTGNMTDFINVGNAPTKITSASFNANGSIVASDFHNNDILILSSMNDLVGGFFVQVERVYAENFPEVFVELRVQNRNYDPVVGLQESNFLITEDQRPVAEQRLIGIGDENDYCDITILIDRDSSTQYSTQAIDAAVREIATSMSDSATLRIVSAGDSPFIEYEGNPSVMQDFSSDKLRNPISSAPSTDLAIRLSANELITANPKRAIVYLTAGNTHRDAFSNYTLTEMSSFLNNNGISFLVVNLDTNSLPEEIQYIINKTPGEEYFVFRPQGLQDIVQDVLDIPIGLYQFSYVSTLPTDFGSLFLPVEAEVYLMNSSGRDETGYFAPYE